MSTDSDRQLRLHPAARTLPIDMMGPFVTLGEGELLTVDDRAVLLSSDGGQSWHSHALFSYGRNEKEHKISQERALLRSRNGTIVLSFLDLNERHFTWRDELRDILPGNRLPHCVTRSLDGGRSWEGVQMLHQEWTGDVRDMIQTRSGRIVISSMKMLSGPGRHGVLTYCSADEGATWTASNLIDLGGCGHHGGVSEAALVELRDGRLWMLLRTNWGRFWQAFSGDEGLSWREIGPSAIAASSAPGLLRRLESGRIALLWNRPLPEGAQQYPLRGGDGLWSEVPVSNHREELSLAFSEDEGKTWSPPVVLARCARSSLSYPRVLEARSGELWVTTMQGGLRLIVPEEALARGA